MCLNCVHSLELWMDKRPDAYAIDRSSSVAQAKAFDPKRFVRLRFHFPVPRRLETQATRETAKNAYFLSSSA